MMNLIAENLRLRWRLSVAWKFSGEAETRRKAGQAGPAGNTTRQNTGVEKSADVLEEIWRTADRRRPKDKYYIALRLTS